MRSGRFLFSAVTVLGLLAVTGGCGLLGGSETKESGIICDPGGYVFCKCADRADGTKLCKGDGKSFEACTTNGAGECVGGEIEDPQTNQPVPGTSSGEDPIPVGPSALNACPGKSTAVPPGVAIKLEGDTATATEDRKGKTGNSCAAGAGAKDHVYRLIPSGSGTLDVSVQGSGALDPVAYIRTGCDKEDTQVDCAPQNVKKLTSLSLKVITGTEYFLVIDGVSGSTGPYAATVKLTTGAFCGDGKVDLNEACDDINKVDKDGCSPDCRRVDGNPASAGTCPGQPVDVWPSQTVTGAGSTTSYPNTWPYPTPSCSTTGGTLADSDHLYAVKPHASGSLVVAITTLAGGPNLMLSSRTNCDVATSSCANATGAAGAETLTVPVTNGNVVYVGVGGGGATNNKGDYNISFKLQ